MIEIRCGNCGKRFQVRDELQGKRGRCSCGNAIAVPISTAPSINSAQATKPVTSANLQGTPALDPRMVLERLCILLGAAGLSAAVFGCILYLIIWRMMPVHEQLAVLAAVDSPGSGKVLLPRLVNYLGLILALSAIILGAVSYCRTRRVRPLVPGMGASFLVIVCLLGFWFWSVSRDYRDYVAGGHDGEKGKSESFYFPDALESKVVAPEKSAAPKSIPADPLTIDSFLGISSDFKFFAKSVDGKPKLFNLDTGDVALSPHWDSEWGSPREVVFGNGIMAVTTGRSSGESVRVLSRKTGELEQNLRGQVSQAALTDTGRFLAITQFQPSVGFHLILRDIEAKKNIAELRVGGNGYCSLAVGGKYVAIYESRENQLTLVEAETGKVLKKFGTPTFRKTKGLAGIRIPLALSGDGKLLSWGVDDEAILYDLETEKIVAKLEGHLDVIQAIAFSPRGQHLASAGKDKTLRYWNIDEKKEIQSLKNLPARPARLVFSSDGHKIALLYGDENSTLLTKAEIRTVKLPAK